MLLNRFIVISAVLGLLTILLTLRAVRRGWTRKSQQIRRRLEAGRILRRAERIPARASVQVMGDTTGADLRVALVLTETELHFFLHSDGELARRANGAPFHVLLTPAARDRRELALVGAPVRDGAAVELRLANPSPVSWRLTFPDEADAKEWFALIDGIVRAPIDPPEIRGR
jgi:hypothetical protein